MAGKEKKPNMLGLLIKAFSYQFKISPAHKQLAQKLNTMANGYPQKGAALRILAELFTSEEAALAVAFEEGNNTAAALAKKLGQNEVELEQKLYAMAKKGVIFHANEDGVSIYKLVPFIVGILEFQIDNPSIPLKINMGMMFGGGFTKTFYAKSLPHLRTIPIAANVVQKDTIMPYDDVVEILKTRKKIALGECVCRNISDGMGKVCEHSRDTCFAFDDWADYYVDIGIAKYITLEEALEKAARNEKEGLINQVANSKNPELMCSCCSCHCFVLGALNEKRGPAAGVISNYYCEFDNEKCTNCGACVKRCAVGAIKFENGVKTYDQSLCIGCGLCATVCPVHACSLKEKSEQDHYVPLDSIFDTYKEMAEH